MNPKLTITFAILSVTIVAGINYVWQDARLRLATTTNLLTGPWFALTELSCALSQHAILQPTAQILQRGGYSCAKSARSRVWHFSP